MSRRKFWLGTKGPFFYDPEKTRPDGTAQAAFSVEGSGATVDGLDVIDTGLSASTQQVGWWETKLGGKTGYVWIGASTQANIGGAGGGVSNPSDFPQYSFATTAASEIEIQAFDLNGSTISAEDFLRVRLCNNTSFLPANSTLQVRGDTEIISSFASSDLFIKSSTSGLFKLGVSGLTGQYILRLGPPPISGRRGLYTSAKTLVLSAITSTSFSYIFFNKDNVDDKIYRMELSTGNSTLWHDAQDGRRIRDIVVDNDFDDVYYSGDYWPTIYRTSASTSTNSRTLISRGTNDWETSLDINFSSTANRVWATQTNERVYGYNRSGTQTAYEQIWSAAEDFRPTFIRYHQEQKRWAIQTGGGSSGLWSVDRNDPSNDSLTYLLESQGTKKVAMDTVRDKIIYALSSKEIYQVNLDGSSKEVLHTNSTSDIRFLVMKDEFEEHTLYIADATGLHLLDVRFLEITTVVSTSSIYEFDLY